jgi:hypothetical protein
MHHVIQKSFDCGAESLQATYRYVLCGTLSDPLLAQDTATAFPLGSSQLLKGKPKT